MSVCLLGIFWRFGDWEELNYKEESKSNDSNIMSTAISEYYVPQIVIKNNIIEGYIITAVYLDKKASPVVIPNIYQYFFSFVSIIFIKK